LIDVLGLFNNFGEGLNVYLFLLQLRNSR